MIPIARWKKLEDDDISPSFFIVDKLKGRVTMSPWLGKVIENGNKIIVIFKQFVFLIALTGIKQ